MRNRYSRFNYPLSVFFAIDSHDSNTLKIPTSSKLELVATAGIRPLTPTKLNPVFKRRCRMASTTNRLKIVEARSLKVKKINCDQVTSP